MKELTVTYNGKPYHCEKYEQADEPRIIETFFSWRIAVLLAGNIKSKNPPIPETFSEPFCCLVCDLLHKPGTGYDAFRQDNSGHVFSVEIKATITGTGFTDVKRDLDFDELYWLSFCNYAQLRYEIYRLSKTDIFTAAGKSNTARERATVGLAKIVETAHLRPIQTGYIGIVREK
ncbi:MAG: hypothetical protein NT169_05020 [Chloroflexi bacterium]|nr:hypothetical protein [Chloroflexota bacterium]